MPKPPSFKHDTEVLIREDTDLPYSAEIADLADRVFDELQDSPRPTLEHAGYSALGILLDDYASGRMDKKQAFGFLKSLVDRKTPQPVQRIEQHVEMDMRVLMADLLGRSDETHEAAIEKANKNKLEIMARYGLDESLQLPPRAAQDQASSQNDDNKDVPCTGPNTTLYSPGDEPEEIREIRRKNE